MAQDLCGVLERTGALQAVRLRHPHVLQGDASVLHHAQIDFALHLLCAEAGRALFDEEALHLPIVEIARPDHDHVGKGGVAEPGLRAVQYPSVAVTARGGVQAAGDARAGLRLGQCEGAGLLAAPHQRQPVRALLVGAA